MAIERFGAAIVEVNIVTQTQQTIENVKAILLSLGLSLEHVVKATVWLADTRDFWSFNKVYLEYFGMALPARSCARGYDGGLQGRD
jgi:enamine deaminase RidA (YjgF/YER057c/UK114 family)